VTFHLYFIVITSEAIVAVNYILWHWLFSCDCKWLLSIDSSCYKLEHELLCLTLRISII